MLKSITHLLEDAKVYVPAHVQGHQNLTCGWACLEMLTRFEFLHSGHETSSGMTPLDMEIFATFCRLHLIPLSNFQIATSALDEGLYLILGRRNRIPHWFILSIFSDVAVVYDPAESASVEYLHHDLPQAYCTDIQAAYLVINCEDL